MLSLGLHLSFPSLYLLIAVMFVINYRLECVTNLDIVYISYFAHILFDYKLVLVILFFGGLNVRWCFIRYLNSHRSPITKLIYIELLYKITNNHTTVIFFQSSCNNFGILFVLHYNRKGIECGNQQNEIDKQYLKDVLKKNKLLYNYALCILFSSSISSPIKLVKKFHLLPIGNFKINIAQLEV